MTHAGFVQNDDREQKVTEMLGYFWHMIMAADTSLRPGMRDAASEDEARELLEIKKSEFAKKIGIDSAQVMTLTLKLLFNVSKYPFNIM